MSEFAFNGIDELAADMKKLDLLDNETLVTEMLDAGAEVVAEEWRKGVEKTVRNVDDRSYGDLHDSISVNKGIKKVGDVSAKDIYPKGKDRKGVRNAEKAFILHYGKSGQSPTLFVDDVENAAESKAVEAMSDVYNKYLEKEGL